MQPIAWQLSLVLMTLVGFGFAFVAINSGRRQDDYTPLQKRAYRLRTRLFWGLVLVLGPAMIYTLMDLPYGAARAGSGSGPAQIVDATGYQWHWDLSQDHVTAGQPVEFRVTSGDVNHGFGIYDANLHLVAQTQAMPGYTNTLRYTFKESGTYRILCMEYCGVAHHNMMTEIRVDAR
ncbi:MAG TPA: cytochrome C oxidase subunit II [Aromatoleum sp.]|uniref:cytochrome C oxidase subunit II n=1 Tax=Aromatoleum sp. TaxID=2307007 RepID=UPI002B45DD11|nr:cytochrome C oxidase subunit II [Aromatoleum sp.]HJV24032.1 cytochrome C oxidase subunit II [Aromatoleum sp.]